VALFARPVLSSSTNYDKMFLCLLGVRNSKRLFDRGPSKLGVANPSPFDDGYNTSRM
jgi:hypothetical protein